MRTAVLPGTPHPRRVISYWSVLPVMNAHSFSWIRTRAVFTSSKRSSITRHLGRKDAKAGSGEHLRAPREKEQGVKTRRTKRHHPDPVTKDKHRVFDVVAQKFVPALDQEKLVHFGRDRGPARTIADVNARLE
ncbi:MAG: hypothetical protein M3O50_02220 [Myxococcota bacterium]|nr:hypothetical protein [Myxococcota bacterium]